MVRNWLISAREEAGLSQSQIADMIGVSQPTYWEYERGKSTPRIDKAKKIASVLDLSWTRFYDDREENVHENDARP